MTRHPPRHLNIADYFLDDRIREGMGERTAIRTWDGAVDYGELQARANRFANVFAERGVEPEQRVLVALPDVPDFAAALFGALKRGAVAVMVNPRLPADRIRDLFDYVRPKAAVVHADQAATFREAAKGARHAPGLLTMGGRPDGGGPAGGGGGPVGRDGGPVGRDGGPVGRDGGPVGRDGDPVGRDGGPVSRDSGPVGRGGGLVGRAGNPVGRGSVPVGSERDSPSLRRAASGDRAVAAASPDFENFPSHPSDPAVWLFSGGTTGRPKAVVQSHASFVNSTERYAKEFLGYGPDDVALAAPKLYFGYATGSNLFFPLATGGSAVLFPERCTADELFRQIARHRPTILVAVPTMVNYMVSHPEAAGQDLSCLRLATSAGEPLPPELHRRWDETFGVELLDGLGTAEMWHVFISNPPGGARHGTLGRAVPGFEVSLRNERGEEAAPGEVGRMRVRGGSLGNGYWQRPEETRRAFVGPWYVSGDMMTRDADGCFAYRGRADDLLKVKGKWLSPTEVEECMLECPEVSEAAVVGTTTADGLAVAEAFVVPAASVDAERAGSAVRRLLARRLQSYKHPRNIHFLEEMPRTHLGKVDRGALKRSAP